MDTATAITTLNRLLASKEPAQFNSSRQNRHTHCGYDWNQFRPARAAGESACAARVRRPDKVYWIERHETIARWRGHEAELQDQTEACIRRYRYTGSFLTYLFRTLECTERGIVPHQAYSLDHRKNVFAHDRRVVATSSGLAALI
jgi:hypothetical protein